MKRLFIIMILSAALGAGCSDDSSDSSYTPDGGNGDGGSTEEGNGNKAKWIQDALTTVETLPEIKAVCYWNENWDQFDLPVEMKIDSSETANQAYKDGIGKSYFLDTVDVVDGKIVPPQNGAYHAAYPGFAEGSEEVVTTEKIDDFEQLAGKPLAWVYFSDDWSDGIDFPQQKVDTIYSAGSVPFIRLMAWTEYQIEGFDPNFNPQAIIDGDFDTEITQWASDAKATNSPMMVEYGVEVNGNWFPWNGSWNGAGTLDEYGDPNYPDGPERFIDAYRHIVDTFDAAGADNVTWAFHVNAVSFPEEDWNTMGAYYPGDEYVDWIGVSIYGPVNANDPDNYTFQEFIDHIATDFSSMSSEKPLAVFEYGVGEF